MLTFSHKTHKSLVEIITSSLKSNILCRFVCALCNAELRTTDTTIVWEVASGLTLPMHLLNSQIPKLVPFLSPEEKPIITQAKTFLHLASACAIKLKVYNLFFLILTS